MGIKNSKISISSPYHLDRNKELAIGLGGFAFYATGAILNSTHARIDSSQVYAAMASQESLPAFERSAVHQYDATFLLASDVLLYTSMAMPFIAFVDKRVAGHAPQVIIMYAEALAITMGSYSITTGFIERNRPLVYNTDSVFDNEGKKVAEVPFEAKLEKTVVNSFFSGHTAMAATATFFGARVFTDFRPHSKLVPFVWGAAGAVPAFVAFSRYKAGKHFPSDVLTGYAVGAAVGYLIPTLHKIDREQRLSITPFPNAKGLNVSFIF